jgi:hypothetical protein
VAGTTGGALGANSVSGASSAGEAVRLSSRWRVTIGNTMRSELRGLRPSIDRSCGGRQAVDTVVEAVSANSVSGASSAEEAEWSILHGRSTSPVRIQLTPDANRSLA